MRIESVWIVSTDAPDEPEVVLGVFGASSEAAGFIEQIADDFPEGSLGFAEYPVGWRVDHKAARYTS